MTSPSPSVAALVRRDRWMLAAIVAIALAVRVVPAWDNVFGRPEVAFQATDAWYHMRLAESLAHNFPHRVTMDPYAAPGGQFVPIAPLFDYLIAAPAWALGLGSPSPALVDAIGAWLPALLGAGVTVLIFLLGATVFDPRTGLMAAALTAVVPGTFLTRSLLGATDHHVAETFFAVLTILAFARAARSAAGWRPAAWAGVALGAYLLTWMSGAFLVAILCVWAALFVAHEHSRGRFTVEPARIAGVASVVALAIVLAGQDWSTYRFSLQVAALVGTIAAALVMIATSRALARARRSPRLFPIALVALAAGGLALAGLLFSPLARDVLVDLGRFRTAMGPGAVDEARPLLVLGERFSLWPAWDTFRSTAVFGGIGLVWLAARAVGGVAAGEMLVFTWLAAVLLATLGQNRFGYYLAPAIALAGGFVCARLLERAGVGRPRAQRTWRADAAIVLVAALAFYPNLPAALLAARQRDTMPGTWRRALDWLRDETPDPFGDPAFYLARYRDGDATRAPDYTVMSWWDYGYWVIRQGRRVPVTNPTQVNAGTAADFLVATSEADAAAILARTGSRFVAVDREVAFSGGGGGTPLVGKFQGILEWTRQPRSRYYEGYFEADASGTLRPAWIFYPDYYRSMAVRLAAFGGEAVTPRDAWVISWARRPMAGGGAFREIVASRRFATYEEAEAYRASLGPGLHRVVGRDPAVSCVPLAPVGILRPVHAEPARVGPADGGPAVWLFEVPAEPSAGSPRL